MKVLLDEDAGTFMVTDARNLTKENPDVLNFSDVTGCILDIEEDRTELMREDKDGNEVSYNPPRYTYDYDFYVVIQVRNPYFDEIKIQLNDSAVEIRANPEKNMEYRRYKEIGEEIREALLQIRQEVRNQVEAAAAPKTAVTCPYCGATTMPDDAGCCEFCGGAIGS